MLKKIGIYTFHAEINFGAQLQAYSTQRFLNDCGYDAEIVNLYTLHNEALMHYRSQWNSVKGVVLNLMAICLPSIRRKIGNINKFHSEMKLSKRYFSKEEVSSNPPIYDVHLVGSDQVWNIEYGIDKNAYFFLPFLPKDAVRVSYASSFGNTDVDKSLYPKLKELLTPFTAISTREKGGVELIDKAAGLKAAHVLDPVFLLSKEDWNGILPKDRIIKDKYIFYYGFDKDENCRSMIKTLSSHLALPIVSASVSLTSPYKFNRFVIDAGPKEFLRLIRDAEYVITSSFHGMALSINFRRNFVVMKYGTRMSRIESVLDAFGMKERIVSNPAQLRTLLESTSEIVYNEYEKVIKENVEFSQQWLKTHI